MIPSTAHPFRGVYAATLTPFRINGSLDEDVLAEHFSSEVDQGLQRGATV